MPTTGLQAPNLAEHENIVPFSMPLKAGTYLFASHDGTATTLETVFHLAENEHAAESLCRLFAQEYVSAPAAIKFHAKAAAGMAVEELVLLDEALDELGTYTDPDPGVYEIRPSRSLMERAQFAVRAERWEAMLREHTSATRLAHFSSTDDVSTVFVLAADPSLHFGDSPHVLPSRGAVLAEFSETRVAEAVIDMYRVDRGDDALGLVAIDSGMLSVRQRVLASRELQRSQAIGANLDCEDFATRDSTFRKIGRCCVELEQLESEVAPEVARTTAVDSASQPKDALARTLGPTESALAVLIRTVERHRLIFLYFAQAKRINPLAVHSRSGTNERVIRDEVLGWKEMVQAINPDGEFLWTHRAVLDRYAEEAIQMFGPGEGMRAEQLGANGKRVPVKGGSMPYWIIDEGGTAYLEQSSDAILEACGNLAAVDPSKRIQDIVRASIAVAREQNHPRWYTSVAVAWKYLATLDEVIARLKRAKAEVVMLPEHEGDLPIHAGAINPGSSAPLGQSNGWSFSPQQDGQVRAVNDKLCQEYAAMGERDLLILSSRWRSAATQFTAATKSAGCYQGRVTHHDEVMRATRLLETAVSHRHIEGVDRLGRCLRRPDDDHLHWALRTLDSLDAALRVEAASHIQANSAPAEDVPAEVLDFLKSLNRLTEEERRHLLGFYLFMYAQAYHNLVQAVAANDVGWVDVELNGWYLQIVKAIQDLLTLPELKDFPGGFEPIGENLFPSFELQCGWEEFTGPPVMDFLGRAQAYSLRWPLARSENEPLLKSLGELVRLKCQKASEVADRYDKRARTTFQKMLDRAGERNGPATGSTPATTSPPVPGSDGRAGAHAFAAVVLSGPGEPCTVVGTTKQPLTDAQYAVIQALLDAGDSGLSKDALEGVRSSARRILKELQADPDWAAVIVLPGKTNGRYRLRRAVTPVSEHL